MAPQINQYLFFGLIIVVFVVFMFRNSRKRERSRPSAEPGGPAGRRGHADLRRLRHARSIDEDENKIVAEHRSSSQLTVHRQAVGRVVDARDAATTS